MQTMWVDSLQVGRMMMMMVVIMMIRMIMTKMVTKLFFFSALPVRGVQSMLLSVRSLDIIIIMGSSVTECLEKILSEV